jgi:hypothetical protein
MIYLKWLCLFALDLLLLPVAFLLAPVISLFTAKGWPRFGSWFYTYDNPPEGDSGYQAKRAPYIFGDTPWELYVNRVFWMWRNPLYGFQKSAGIAWDSGLTIKLIKSWGEGIRISDKYQKAGGYYAELIDDFGSVIGFQVYIVAPYFFGRCLRIKAGWKIMSDKFQSLGFAPFVDTINPVDGYGND